MSETITLPPVQDDATETLIDAQSESLAKRLFRFSHGYPFPEGEILSPAVLGIISQEMRRLIVLHKPADPSHE